MGLTHRSVGTHAAAFGGTRRAGERIVALAGNPNVGKSTVFNALTGMRQHTGNWAGKTVGCACGRCRSAREHYLLVDLPGTYSLQPHSAEEAVACDFVRGGEADAVVVVCDATCLERTLVLALQMHSVTPNTIVCVNLLDEARHKRIHIDLPALQAQLGMPVVGVTARKKKTLRALLDALDAVMAAPQPRPDGAPEAGDPADDVRRAEAICRAAVQRETPEYAARDRRLDRLLTSRATGYPIMLLGLAAVLWLTIAGANAPSEWLSHFFGWVQGRFSALLIFLHAPPWLQGLLVDGMFRTLAWVVAVMLPPMAIFFPLFTLLEDAGYLPRVAYNLDRPFQACRACGKQALTMCMGLGCNAAGVVGCRIIDSERERLLAVLTNSLMPCNGRFPALIALMTMFFSLSGSTLTAALLLTAALVLFLIAYVLVKGLPNVSWTLLSTAPSYLSDRIGILPDLLNTLYIVIATLLIVLPLGVGAAIYLTEYATNRRVIGVIEYAAETLSGIPSIIYGLVGMLFFCQFLNMKTSLLAGALTLVIMNLPTIMRTTQESLKTVPQSYREGAFGLGAGKWRVIRTVVLPGCVDGVITGCILSVGRILGESAALLFTAGFAHALNGFFDGLSSAGATLTVALYVYAKEQGQFDVAFAIAAILMLLTLLINGAAMLVERYFRRKRSL